MNKKVKTQNQTSQSTGKAIGQLKPGWLTAYQKYYPYLKEDRKRLKNEMTEAEKILWEELRNKKLGAKFRRQHVIGCFIPDFVCLPLKLIIEVDGGIHLKQKAHDNMREERLRLLGYNILRFTNEDVFNDVQLVCEKIKDSILTLSTQAPPSLPPVG